MWCLIIEIITLSESRSLYGRDESKGVGLLGLAKDSNALHALRKATVETGDKVWTDAEKMKFIDRVTGRVI